MKKISLLSTLVIALTLGGCATPSTNSGAVYSRGEARTVAQVRMGVVESVRPVRIEGTKTGIGAIAGGLAGGIAGSTIGSGRGSAIAAVAGAVAGGLGGNWAEEKLTNDNGVEITVRLDNGTMLAVVQSADVQFSAGDRVRLLEQSGATRVSH